MTTSITSPYVRLFRHTHARGTHGLALERLVGFREGAYVDTKAKLAVDDERLVSRVNGASYGIGRFDMVSLAELRQRAAAAGGAAGRPRVSIVMGDLGLTHHALRYAGALFQLGETAICVQTVGIDFMPGQARHVAFMSLRTRA